MRQARRYLFPILVGSLVGAGGTGCVAMDLSLGLGGQCGTSCDGPFPGLVGDTIPVRAYASRAFATLRISGGLDCGTSTAGALTCWGRLGTSYAESPRQFDHPGPYRAAVPGGDYVCALAGAGGVECWGSPMVYELGVPEDRPYRQPSAVPGTDSLVTLELAMPFVSRPFACGLTTDGRALCWGNNTRGSLGRGDSTLIQRTPAEVRGGHRFISISATRDHACAVAVTGTAYCWGSNEFGQLGDGTRTDRDIPTPVAGGHRFTQVAAGWGDTCALTPEGQAYCWGESGNGDNLPHALDDTLRFTSITASSGHACALTTEGQAWCWGSNMSGELGNGRTEYRSPPAPVATSARFTALTLGLWSTCGLTATGEAWCWGYDHTGMRRAAP